MAPYLATSRELLGAAKASLWLGLGHPLYTPRACSLLPPLSVCLLSTEAIAYLITISSSSIDSLVTHARIACSLPYTWAILPYTSCLNIRQVAVMCRRGTSVVRNLKFLTPFSVFLIIKLINHHHCTYSSSSYR